MQTKHRKKKDAGDVPDRPSQRPEVYASRKGLEDVARGGGIEQREGVGEKEEEERGNRFDGVGLGNSRRHDMGWDGDGLGWIRPSSWGLGL